MKKSAIAFLNPAPVLILLVLAGCLFLSAAAANGETIKEIRVLKEPFAVKLMVSGSVPVKVIQVEKNELVIAMRKVSLDKNFKISGREHPDLKQIAVEHLSGGVVAVILTGRYPYKAVSSGFDISGSQFTVHLESLKKGGRQMKPVVASSTEPEKEKTVSPPAQPDVQAVRPVEPKKEQEAVETLKPVPAPEVKPQRKDAVVPVENQSVAARSNFPERKKKSIRKNANSIPEPTVYRAPHREPSRFKGEIGDLIRVVEDINCEAPEIAQALALLRKKRFKDGFNVLDQYLIRENVGCVEEAHFLKALAFYKQVADDDFAQLMVAEKYFQEALIAYPVSDHVPFGYAAIGMIQKKLNNISAAEGYFNIVKQGYLAYSGMPEVLYHLADIYDKKGYLDKALRYFKQVFEDSVLNNYIVDAGIGYGKALFQKKQFLDSLSVLNYVVQTSPKKIYDSHELLLAIGNANFEVGLSTAARQSLTRVLNLFPEIKDPDVILARVGDTFGMENNEDKAMKIYELVREKYPDSQGYIASSIGIARYMKSDDEKIDIYKMIKTKFPENTYARIAMMRLAEIYQANKEYDKCIKEIEDLLSTHPRGLRYEAVRLMQRAYEELFKKQLKSDEFTKVLNRYELDHTKIDRMGSKSLDFSVGTAYLRAKLYEEAFNHLLTAYKQYRRNERSADLLFGLGVAMDETGRDDDALKLFNSFTKLFPKDKNHVQALQRAGSIYFDKNEFKPASAKLTAAFNRSKTSIDKGRILMAHAAVFEKKGDLSTASDLQEKAVKEIAFAKGEHFDTLIQAYKELGRLYMERRFYTDAADAYLKALNLSRQEDEKANLGFLLGDAYQKANVLLKARQAFQQVADLYDSVWARLAQQRLDTLDLAQAVQSS